MTPTNVRSLCRLGQDRSRTEVVDELRRLLSRTAGIPLTSPALPFGLPILDAALPQGGLAYGALHEVLPETDGDMPAAFGFIAALLSRLPHGCGISWTRRRRRRWGVTSSMTRLPGKGC